MGNQLLTWMLAHHGNQMKEEHYRNENATKKCGSIN